MRDPASCARRTRCCGPRHLGASTSRPARFLLVEPARGSQRKGRTSAGDSENGSAAAPPTGSSPGPQFSRGPSCGTSPESARRRCRRTCRPGLPTPSGSVRTDCILPEREDPRQVELRRRGVLLGHEGASIRQERKRCESAAVRTAERFGVEQVAAARVEEIDAKRLALQPEDPVRRAPLKIRREILLSRLVSVPPTLSPTRLLAAERSRRARLRPRRLGLRSCLTATGGPRG